MVSVGVRPLPVSLDMMHQLTRLIASAASIRGCDVCYLTAYEQETEVGEGSLWVNGSFGWRRLDF